MKIKNLKFNIIFIGIILLAAFFRFYGVNWDQNQHLHPDERFLTMVTTGIAWPHSIADYFNTNTSPLNPHNRNFPFIVYGTFPVFFTKLMADLLNLDDYTNLTLVGRQISTLFDLGTVVLVFLIAKQLMDSGIRNQEASKKNHDSLFIIHNSYFPLIAMFFSAASVLSIQLSHFYAVDTYLTFFITLSFYLLIKLINSRFIYNSSSTRLLTSKRSDGGQVILNSILLGLSLGLATASKISALYFSPIIGLGLLYVLSIHKKIIPFIVYCLLFILSFYFTLRIAQPYLFVSSNIFNITPNPKVLANWQQLKSFDDPKSMFPPAIQWITTKPYIFPLKNLLLWGLGLPLGLIAISAVLYSIIILFREIIKSLRKKSFIIPNSHFIILTLCLLWILLLFGYQGKQFVKAMRYFYPLYPFLAIISAWFIIQFCNKFRIGHLGYWVIGLSILAYPLSFISIYSQPHSRITASKWIYKNISPGSTLANEYWDDPLPLNLPTYTSQYYKGIMLPLYDPDSREKWNNIAKELSNIDYIILSSNRLYGSITTVPQKYPISTKYYQSLFDGSLGFEKVAEFTSRPNIPIPFLSNCVTPPFIRYGIIAKKTQECPLLGITFVDDYADEPFTVYDHPKVILFKKVNNVDYLKILFK